MQTQKPEKCLGYGVFKAGESLKPVEFDLHPLGPEDVEIQVTILLLNDSFFQKGKIPSQRRFLFSLLLLSF